MDKGSTKVYSKNQIDIATFFGGPLIAGHLLSHNFKVFGDSKSAKNSTLYSIVGVFTLIALSALLPPSITSKMGIAIAILPVIVTTSITKQYQSKKLQESIKSGYQVASPLGLIGKTVLSLILTLALYLIVYRFTVGWSVKNNYGGYLENYCKTFTESSIRSNKQYVPEDASCFVAKRLEGKGYTLKQVDEVLTQEFEYQKSIGTVGGVVGNNQQINPTNLQNENPVPYIYSHQKLGLSQDQITEILNMEVEYLQLIGVVISP